MCVGAQGISRNEPSQFWRIHLVHENELLTANIYDDGRTAQDSLADAYAMLMEAAQGLVSRFVVDRRSRVPGSEREPLIDTGMTGVTVSRSVRQNRKCVVVVAHQMVASTDGEAVVRSLDDTHGIDSHGQQASSLNLALGKPGKVNIVNCPVRETSPM